MPRVSDAFLAELGLKRADHPVHEWGDDPGSEIWRAGLTHPVLCRMLESAETHPSGRSAEKSPSACCAT